MKWEGQSEAAIARLVVEELQRQGYETYEEVSMGYSGHRADVVAVHGPVVMVVECKLALSVKLLDQMCHWSGRAHRIIGAVGHGRLGETMRRFCQWQGFGLWYALGAVEESIAPRLPGLIRKGIVDGIRVEDGPTLRVFPDETTTPNAKRPK